MVMQDIKHRLSTYDVGTIGKFETALKNEFGLRVIFRIPKCKEHLTNDANLRDICAALESPTLNTEAKVRQLFAEKMTYMRYPRGSIRPPKETFVHPEKSEVEVIHFNNLSTPDKIPAEAVT